MNYLTTLCERVKASMESHLNINNGEEKHDQPRSINLACPPLLFMF